MSNLDERKKERVNTRKEAFSKISQQLYEIGKLPPQAVDLEEAVLGALMLDKDALTAVIEILKPKSFYKEAHERIFSAIQRLFSKSEPIDILTVTQELRKSGELEIVGGAYYISQLTNRVASAANAEYHARIIAQKYIQRELIKSSTEIIRDAYEESSDVFDLLDKAEKGLFDIVDGNVRKQYDDIHTLMGKAIKEIEAARQLKTGITGVPSGFTVLDKITSGWQKSDLIILAARPAMGKTAFVLSLARNAAVLAEKPVAVFSLEMSNLQLVNRLISSETELPAEKLKKGQLEDYEFQQLNTKITQLADAKIFIDDTPALNIFELRAKARKLVHQHKVELIVIDYLQLMHAGGENNKFNREQEVSTISRSLKSIAKELNIPIIALSQLNRSVEVRTGSKKPQLSDLRESGAIEQDADMVVFLHRPEYYGMFEDEKGNPTHGICEVIIAKHRNGPVTSVNVRFIDTLAKFVELEPGAGMSSVNTGTATQVNTINPDNTFLDNPNTITRQSEKWDNSRDIEEDETPF
ncbi:MAG: replicative DNA helicase [Bacteroidia bacterium]|nr:replicative DNA helicase [Bacteroidia bacterium]